MTVTATEPTTQTTGSDAGEHAAEVAEYKEAADSFRPYMEDWFVENVCELGEPECRCVVEAYEDLDAGDLDAQIVAMIEEDPDALEVLEGHQDDCRAPATSDAVMASLPPDARKAVRDAVAQFKRAIAEHWGTEVVGDPRDLTCGEWAIVPRPLRRAYAEGVLEGRAPEANPGAARSAREIVKRVDAACEEQPDGSATGWLAREMTLLLGVA